jgi:hypothetical protein
MIENTQDLTLILLLAIPIVLIQLGLQIYALVDLARQPKVRGPKWVWVIIILLGELIGAIVYLVFGRKEA